MQRERAIEVRSRRAAPPDAAGDSTGQRILEAAVRVLEAHSVSQLTLHAVAQEAGVADRTVFRYFATRDVFLDAIASTVARKLSTPDPPSSLRELVDAPRALYSAIRQSLAGLGSRLNAPRCGSDCFSAPGIANARHPASIWPPPPHR